MASGHVNDRATCLLNPLQRRPGFLPRLVCLLASSGAISSCFASEGRGAHGGVRGGRASSIRFRPLPCQCFNCVALKNEAFGIDTAIDTPGAKRRHARRQPNATLQTFTAATPPPIHPLTLPQTLLSFPGTHNTPSPISRILAFAQALTPPPRQPPPLSMSMQERVGRLGAKMEPGQYGSPTVSPPPPTSIQRP